MITIKKRKTKINNFNNYDYNRKTKTNSFNKSSIIITTIITIKKRKTKIKNFNNHYRQK